MEMNHWKCNDPLSLGVNGETKLSAHFGQMEIKGQTEI